MSASSERQTIVLPPPVPLTLYNTPSSPPYLPGDYVLQPPVPLVPAQLIPTDNPVVVPIAACPLVIAAAAGHCDGSPYPAVNSAVQAVNSMHLSTCLADSNALNKALNSLNLNQTSTMQSAALGVATTPTPMPPPSRASGPCAPDLVTYSHYVNGSILSVPKCQSWPTKGANGDELVVSVYGFVKSFLGASGTNQGAIDNRIEQAMDLVKSHLMNAVRSEVEELKDKIKIMEATICNLQAENDVLKRNVPGEVLLQLQSTSLPALAAPAAAEAVTPAPPAPSASSSTAPLPPSAGSSSLVTPFTTGTESTSSGCSSVPVNPPPITSKAPAGVVMAAPTPQMPAAAGVVVPQQPQQPPAAAAPTPPPDSAAVSHVQQQQQQQQ